MTRISRLFLILVLASVFTGPAFGDPGFQTLTLTFTETWTGNVYVPPDYAVTGSEANPIDTHVGAGTRINLVDPFLFQSGALTLDPRLTIGTRYYLVYQSGWVVPTPIETALGADENGDPGYGSSRVLTFTLAAPIGLEIGMGERAALTIALSPTMVFRVRAGDAAYDTVNGDLSDLNAMYPFFYGSLRWLRPELHLATRFKVSDYLSFGIRLTSSVSILDMADPTFPWWDQLQVGGSFELSASPPFSGLFRPTNDPTLLPETQP